jgi:acyl-CoA synthetase (AMP-forming)/AMP-acid ligase II
VSGWNFADVWEVVAEVLPDTTALVHGELHRTWREFDARAEGLAATLNDIEDGTVAQYLPSCPEYLEAVFAAFKLGRPPVNTNYRYAPDELSYLWDNADCAAVVFHGEFTERVDAVRRRVPRVTHWLHVDDGTHPCPTWATPYEQAASAPPGPRRERSPDDLYLVYTGGTTGLPKGVMWRQDDLFALLNATAPVRYPEEGGLDDVRRALVKPGPPHIPAAPLMHGTGSFTSFAVMSSGGSIVTLTGRHFRAVELLDTIEREQVRSLAIVGDAFAKPILSALDSEPGRWDVSSLRVLTSSGVMFSAAVKEGLLRHVPRLIIADTLGSSEALGMATSVSTADGPARTAVFTVGPSTRVITEDGRDVVPGSGEVGLMAQRGRVPLGYYKDEAGSARTFRVLDGVRWSVPGDWATVEADGTLRLLGRGSQCINTGGEKVYPEEVEEALKTYPGIVDAACVGVPDDRFGEVVVALVQATGAVDEAAVIAHVKGVLAGYKAPRRVVQLPTLGRAPNGKVDYAALRAHALA